MESLGKSISHVASNAAIFAAGQKIEQGKGVAGAIATVMAKIPRPSDLSVNPSRGLQATNSVYGTAMLTIGLPVILPTLVVLGGGAALMRALSATPETPEMKGIKGQQEAIKQLSQDFKGIAANLRNSIDVVDSTCSNILEQLDTMRESANASTSLSAKEKQSILKFCDETEKSVTNTFVRREKIEVKKFADAVTSAFFGVQEKKVAVKDLTDSQLQEAVDKGELHGHFITRENLYEKELAQEVSVKVADNRDSYEPEELKELVDSLSEKMNDLKDTAILNKFLSPKEKEGLLEFCNKINESIESINEKRAWEKPE